jgi:hypothetical protein
MHFTVVKLKEKKMTKEEAVAKIAELVQQAYDALRAAEGVADEHKLSFHFSASYGMGGYYNGDESERYYGDDGWHPSSQSC